MIINLLNNSELPGKTTVSTVVVAVGKAHCSRIETDPRCTRIANTVDRDTPAYTSLIHCSYSRLCCTAPRQQRGCLFSEPVVRRLCSSVGTKHHCVPQPYLPPSHHLGHSCAHLSTHRLNPRLPLNARCSIRCGTVVRCGSHFYLSRAQPKLRTLRAKVLSVSSSEDSTAATSPAFTHS
jgi:hypothetical protein